MTRDTPAYACGSAGAAGNPAAMPEISHPWQRQRPAAVALWTKCSVIALEIPWHAPCSAPGVMHLSAPLRSLTAMVVVVLLCGTTALPLALCASRSTRAGCAALRQQPASHASCHEPQVPATSLSCCCAAASDPTSTPATSIVPASLLPVIVSVVGAVVPPATEGLNRVFESAPLKGHAPPLFTLHSAFLI